MNYEENDKVDLKSVTRQSHAYALISIGISNYLTELPNIMAIAELQPDESYVRCRSVDNILKHLISDKIIKQK